MRSVAGARGSKVGFHSPCQVVPTLAIGGGSRWFISTEHRTATAGATAGERGAIGASHRHGANVDRMPVAVRTSPGSRGTHLVANGANPACGRSAGAGRSGAIHSGSIDEPGMHGRSPANGNSLRRVACARDEFAATVSATKVEKRRAGELRLVTPGIAGCGGKLRGRAFRSSEVPMLAGTAGSATNSAAGGGGCGAGGGVAAGVVSTGGTCGTSCVRCCLFCIRKSSARASCFFRYAFWWASEQNSACCSARSTPIFFPQKAHSIRPFNRLKPGARAGGEDLGCGRRNTLTGICRPRPPQGLAIYR